MLMPKVTEITRAGHAWTHPATPRAIPTTRPVAVATGPPPRR